jgi:hypothetical protein
MPHFMACISDNGGVTVASDCEPGRVVSPPWMVVSAAELDQLKSRAAAAYVPPTISARQIRLWLVTHGIPLDTVDATIDSIADQATRDTVRVEWDYAPYVDRSHRFLVPLAAALGLDEAAVDQAFREAATL